MPKYYYDDPLQAAYMAREFNVELNIQLRGGLPIRTPQSEAFINDFCHLQKHEMSQSLPYWVNEKCNEIFRPQSKDWGRSRMGDWCFFYKEWLNREFKPIEDQHTVKIIWRQKHFFAPKISLDSHLPTQAINDFLKDK